MAYDPRRPHHERYVQNPPPMDPALYERIVGDSIKLCRALGYDLNTLEFAVEDGVPYAIDFLNPAPDAERTSVGDANFDWIVNAVAEFAVKKAQEPAAQPPYHWAAFLGGTAAPSAASLAPSSPKPARAAKPKATAKKKSAGT
jgi:hypothetical protein